MPVIFSVLSSPQLSDRQLSLGMLWVTLSPWAWLCGSVGSMLPPPGRLSGSGSGDVDFTPVVVAAG